MLVARDASSRSAISLPTALAVMFTRAASVAEVSGHVGTRRVEDLSFVGQGVESLKIFQTLNSKPSANSETWRLGGVDVFVILLVLRCKAQCCTCPFAWFQRAFKFGVWGFGFWMGFRGYCAAPDCQRPRLSLLHLTILNPEA